MKPNPAKKLLLLSCFFLVALCLVDYKGAAAGESGTHVLSMCNGSIAECDKECELLMESDISRRILEEQRYITKSAQNIDQPACTCAGPGDPYLCYPEKNRPTYSRVCSI